MDNNQELLIALLSCAIHNRKLSGEQISSAHWHGVFRLAGMHSVTPLAYSALDNKAAIEYVPVEYRDTFIKSLYLQIQALSAMDTVIQKLVDSGIQVIAMKGLVLRELYPNPETRTMGDFDLCVREKDFQLAVNVLMELDFKINGPGIQIHIQLIRDNIIVELHRQPFDNEREDIPEGYVDGLWERAVPVDVCGKSILTFCDNDMILYLLLHMNGHYHEGGFGLRQLCDIVLFVEANKDKIDWSKLLEKAEELHISRFAMLVFSACHSLFGLQLPEGIKDKVLVEEHHLELFIQDIFKGGTFGASSDARYASSRISDKLEYKEYKGMGKIIGLVRFLFPARRTLGEKYIYAKLYPVLLPAAWVHRWFYNIFNRRQRSLLSVLFSRRGKADNATDMEQRQTLVRWLSKENESK